LCPYTFAIPWTSECNTFAEASLPTDKDRSGEADEDQANMADASTAESNGASNDPG